MKSTKLFSILALAGLAITACAAPTSPTDSAPTLTGDDAPKPANAREQSSPTSRLVLTTEKGVLTLDTATLKPVGKLFPREGFLRLNPAGDGRHVLISTDQGFEAFDVGSWEMPHGDHSHFYTAPPRFTNTKFAADTPGHVVVHHGHTALFADGTGEITVFKPQDLAKKDAPATSTHRTPEAHHGVAVPLPDGGLLTTRSKGKDRVGITVLDRVGQESKEVTSADNCPGTHGEAGAEGGVVVVGCTDGALIFKEGKITKATSPDSYGRIGNQSGSEKSPIVLGDYKIDKNAKPERPTRVSLIDTRDASLKHVELGASYSFRSLGRGPEGEALVLGTDGALHMIDPLNAKVTRKIAVIPTWTESATWQEPRPSLFVQGSTAYITEPDKLKLHAVDLVSGSKLRSVDLPAKPNEITGISGKTTA